MKLGRILHKIVLLRPLLKLLGVKDHTVAAKVGEGLQLVDRAVNEDEPKRGDEGIVLLLIAFIILMILPVIAMVADALSYR